MNIYEMIKKCSNDEELRDLVDSCIEVYTKLAYKENNFSTYIGTKLDINPVNSHIDDKLFEFDKYYEAVNVWLGYVPLGMKIVYGRYYNEKYKTSSHKGSYYYLDDDSYIFDFFKYLKKQDISDEYDLIVCVDCFLKRMFDKPIDAKEREDINKLIYRDEDYFYRPCKEHSIKDFYNNGSAMCSEISIVAENLISVLGLEIISMQDKGHAYNIYVSHSKEGNGIYILDFADWVGCYNFKFELINTFPFFKKIENCTSKDIDEIVNEGRRITMNDYYLYFINNETYEITTKKTRSYGVDFAIEEEKSLILKRKESL